MWVSWGNKKSGIAKFDRWASNPHTKWGTAVDEDVGGYARNNAPFNTYGDEDIGGYARNNAPFNTFADEDIGGYARNNAPFNTFADEDIGGYARNNAPFNTFADEDIGGYARNNAPFNTFADEDHSEDNSVGSVRCSKPKCEANLRQWPEREMCACETPNAIAQVVLGTRVEK